MVATLGMWKVAVLRDKTEVVTKSDRAEVPGGASAPPEAVSRKEP